MELYKKGTHKSLSLELLKNKDIVEYFKLTPYNDKYMLSTCNLCGGKVYTKLSTGMYSCMSCNHSNYMFNKLQKLYNIKDDDVAIKFVISHLSLDEKEYRVDIDSSIYDSNVEFLKDTIKNIPKRHLEYLYDRGFTDNTIHDFGLGFHDGKTNVDKVKIGIESNNYNFMQDRITIPIVNENRKLLGFGGRSLNKEPKYVNSKKTSVFNKKEVLFGINKAYKHIIEQDRVIVVEGFFDMIKMYQEGIKNVVALCGVSLNELHILSLNKYTKNIVVCLDGDKAGMDTMDKLKSNLNKSIAKDIKFLYLDNGLDPDEYIVKFGVDKLESKIRRL